MRPNSRCFHCLYGFDFDFLPFSSVNSSQILLVSIIWPKKTFKAEEKLGLERQVFPFIKLCVFCFYIQICLTNFLDPLKPT